MHSTSRIIGIVFVFALTWIAWAILGAVTTHRTETQSERLGEDVNTLWGQPQAQVAPSFTHTWSVPKMVERTAMEGDKPKLVRERILEEQALDVSPASTSVDAAIRLDQRLRGLMWYSLYDVSFSGAWTYEHTEATAGKLLVGFRFPDPSAVYDDFRFVLNGSDLSARLHPKDGALVAEIPIAMGEHVTLAISYKTRGRDRWSYAPVTSGVDGLRHFAMRIATDFATIDFPVPSMSPSQREKTDAGYALQWRFEHVYTGQVMGVVMPAHIQPGEIAAALSYSAPVSLLFFFVILFVLSVLRGLDIHPLNYLFVAAAFFSFQLLFSYLTDTVPMAWSFAIASLTSIGLVTSYLRLVVSARFAYLEAACAQLVYQVGFAAAHFLQGHTGLTVTVLATLTLALLMQMTGRVRWSATLAGASAK